MEPPYKVLVVTMWFINLKGAVRTQCRSALFFIFITGFTSRSITEKLGLKPLQRPYMVKKMVHQNH